MAAEAPAKLESTGPDEVLEQIADFAHSLTYDQIPGYARDAAKLRLVDSLGCAIGAWGCETAEIGRRVASTVDEPALQGRVIGSDERLAAPSAAFVNGCLVRDLDFNDTYPGGHPSDSLAALFAVAPQVGATGKDLIAATVITYEIFIRLQMAGKLRERGWDNGFGIGVGTAAALGHLLRLDRDQVRNALAITATANIPMRATRAGMLSMWKGAATAFATQNAVFATQLAAAGMSGPQAPITGRHGLVDLVTGPLELPPFGDEYFIPRAKIKYWPVVYNMQALVWAAIELRVRLAGREPASIHAHTSWSAWHESGSEAAKWDPRTRETADHSLPYILAWTLRHGSVGHEAFEPASYLDESLRPVMNRIEVTVDDAITAEFPDTIRMRLVAVDDQGAEHTVEIVNPLGHEANPIARDGIDEKFLRLAEPRLGRGAVEDALEYWWSIEDRGVDAGLDLLRV